MELENSAGIYTQGLLKSLLLCCFCCACDKPPERKVPRKAAVSVVDSPSRKVTDTTDVPGWENVKWSYYCFYALTEENHNVGLEYYYISPTLFDLELLHYKIAGDTIHYHIQATFESARYHCIREKDSLQILGNKAGNRVFCIVKYGSLFTETITLPRNWLNKAALRRVGSFLDDYGHRMEVNPWFKMQAQKRGL